MLRILFTTIILSFSAMLMGQNVGIGTNTPDPSAKLDIFATDQGLLVPRVQLDDVNTAAPITNPAEGLIIYNETGTAPTGFYFWDGTAWSAIGSDGFPYDNTGVADGNILSWNAANGQYEPVGASNGLSQRIGEFFFAKSGSTVQGLLPVTPGTVANGAVDYPVWAAMYPEFVSGNDIVFPADVAGMFLRNTGGQATTEGAIQADATSLPNSNFITNAAGLHSHIYNDNYILELDIVGGFDTDAAISIPYPNNAGTWSSRMKVNEAGGEGFRAKGVSETKSAGNAGEHSHTIVGGGDAETRPINRAFQLYTIVDTYDATGLVGPAGAVGPQGPAGADGADGIDGAVGPQGPIGATGADGPQGPIGLTGADGPQGPIGATGADGSQGPVGPAGADGIDGIDGAVGPQGPIGLTGADGPQGLPGADGIDGAVGPQGPIGLTGPAGPTGADGPQGPAGTNGVDGAVGPAGPQGPAGTGGDVWRQYNTTNPAATNGERSYRIGQTIIGASTVNSTVPRFHVEGEASLDGRVWFGDYAVTGSGSIEHGSPYGLLLTTYNEDKLVLWGTGVSNSLFLQGGRFGFGVSNPTKGKVQVEGSASYNSGNYGYLNGGGNVGTGSGTNNVSIWASDRIICSEFNAFSDVRIKNIIGLSNNKNDLNTLMGIQITDYTMIDKMKGTKAYKKVIAQQVEEVFPQAVSEVTDVVPDIFQIATLTDGRIELKNDLKKGDKVKLIFSDEEMIVEVLAADENSFEVDREGEEDVFVYGREVDDFHIVDYEAISMLNVSATQELYGEIEALKAENAQMKAENAQMKAQLAKANDLEAKLDVLTAALESQGIQVNGTAKK